MDQPPVDNETDFVVHPQPLIGPSGEMLVAIVKGTWHLPRGTGHLELAPPKRQRGIRSGPFPWGEPGVSSDMLPSDLCVRRPGTDVVIAARAYAPGGRASQWDVSARVGRLQKALRVFGRRVWEGGGQGMSAPSPIADLDLRYEHAWGGLDMNDAGDIAEEPRNPMGRGVALDVASLTHQPAPQIEDPFDLIRTVLTKPAPAGFSPIMIHWEPRRSFRGSYDAAWLDQRAPLPPADADDRLHNVASPGLHSDTPLRGNEEVALSGTMPGGGGVTFALPGAAVEIAFEHGDDPPVVVHPHLDTVVIDTVLGPDRGWPVVELSWRAAIPAPRRLKEVTVRVTEIPA